MMNNPQAGSPFALACRAFLLSWVMRAAGRGWSLGVLPMTTGTSSFLVVAMHQGRFGKCHPLVAPSRWWRM